MGRPKSIDNEPIIRPTPELISAKDVPLSGHPPRVLDHAVWADFRLRNFRRNFLKIAKSLNSARMVHWSGSKDSSVNSDVCRDG